MHAIAHSVVRLMLVGRRGPPLLFLCAFFIAGSACAQLCINEVLPANATGLRDEDGDRKDWIELFNPGPEMIDLAGYTLSDDVSDPWKWTFESCLIRPQSHALLFASGKDRHCFIPEHWETILDWGDMLAYRVGDSEAPPGWREPEFDDGAWPRGPSGIGWSDGDDATEIPPCPSCQIRFSFELTSPDEVSALKLHVDYDDGFVAYLNGVEIARANLGIPGTPPPYDQDADENIEARLYRNLPVTCFPVEDFAAMLRSGRNTLAIQVHNHPASSDMTLIPFLTLGLNQTPSQPRGIPEVIRRDFGYLHSNFQLDQDGETLLLCGPDGALLDILYSDSLPGDVSRGRLPDGAADFSLFALPTPRAPNDSPPCSSFVAAPLLTPAGGFQSAEILVEMTCATPSAEIHYSLGGDDPTQLHPSFGAPLSIGQTCVLRARAFLPGAVPSPITTHSYFFDEEISLATISLVTDPGNLWDPETGILAIGDGNPDYPYNGANFWKDWERPVHLEMFEPDGSLAFGLDAGILVFGGVSRVLPQKSFRIVSRDSYGESPIAYRIFPQLEIDSFKQILLRNSGQDNCRSHFRDGLMHELALAEDIDLQAYRPAVIFLNGVYWGILNIRERQNEHYLASHHGVDPDAVDMVRYPDEVINGSVDDYLDLADFIDSHPMDLEENYDYVADRIDLASFREYNAMNIFYGNDDWPGANTKFWRPWTEGGRWRFLAFDMDAGLGWSGGPFSNDLFRVLQIRTGQYPFSLLCDNANFRRDFINTMAEFISGCFSISSLLAKLDATVDLLEPEIERHMLRWDHDLNYWNESLDIITDFLERRGDFLSYHVCYDFGLSDTLHLSLDVSPPGAGRFLLTTRTVDPPWDGLYFVDNGIPLTALSRPGFTFAGWSDPGLPSEPELLLEAHGDTSLTALFLPGSAVVINEINYNAASDFDPGDWIEFHNHSGAPVDLGGCHFRDQLDEHDYVFPQPSIVPANGYLLLCQDSAVFRFFFPDIENLLGGLEFGFAGDGELLRLLDENLLLLDHVLYDDVPPWPPEANGGGPTLELISPDSDNALPQNWGASTGHGTPGAVNSVTSVGVDTNVPAFFSLSAPYPNPFNPATTLRFSLPAAGKVELSFFDVGGRLVYRIDAGRLEAGFHEVTWRPEGLASGLYFCRLKAGRHDETRRLLLLK